MGRKVKAKLVEGRPIIFDFLVEDEIIGYEMICPKCENNTFVISIDESRIACTNSECFAPVCIRLTETISDMANVTWKV